MSRSVKGGAAVVCRSCQTLGLAGRKCARLPSVLQCSLRCRRPRSAWAARLRGRRTVRCPRRASPPQSPRAVRPSAASAPLLASIESSVSAFPCNGALVERSSQKPVPSRFSMRSTASGKHMIVLVCNSCCSSALRGTAAPGPLVGSGASYRSRRAALCGVAANNPVRVQRAACSHPSPNPSVNRTSASGLRPLAAAGYLKR